MISQYLGFDSDYIIIGLAALVLILIILMIINVVQMSILKKSYKIFMKGKNAENLDGAIRESFKQIEKINVEHQKTMIKVEESVHRINSVFQKLGIVKYNAFKEMGGNLSFAFAMLDQNNTGFILNSVHSREGCYLYIKDIEKGETETLLGSEEKEALERALGY